MIEIDKTVYPWFIKCMYEETHIQHYGQFPIGIRFHLGIIDNHHEMKKAYESDNEFYTDKLLGWKILTKDLKKIRTEGAFLYDNNETFNYEHCTPTPMRTVKYDHWKYIRTNTFWGKRGLTVFGYDGWTVHTYIPEKNHSKILFWNWVYQDWLLKFKTKTKLPTSTLNHDDEVQVITFEHDGMEREVRICLSTEDKYRNHAKALDGAKIFVKPEESDLRVLYK